MQSNARETTATMKSTLKLVSDHKLVASRIRKTSADIGKAQSFSELAALVLARRYDAIGRKKDARRILTSYLSHHCSTLKITNALNCYC